MILDDPRLEKGQKGEASGGVFGHLRFGDSSVGWGRNLDFPWKVKQKNPMVMCFFQLVPHNFWDVLFEMINLIRFLIAKMCEIQLDWGIHSMRMIFEEDISDARLLFSKLPANMPSLPSTFSNPTFPKDSSSHHFNGFNSHVVLESPLKNVTISGLQPNHHRWLLAQILGPGSARWHFSDSLVRPKKNRNAWEDGYRMGEVENLGEPVLPFHEVNEEKVRNCWSYQDVE